MSCNSYILVKFFVTYIHVFQSYSIALKHFKHFFVLVPESQTAWLHYSIVCCKHLNVVKLLKLLLTLKCCILTVDLHIIVINCKDKIIFTLLLHSTGRKFLGLKNRNIQQLPLVWWTSKHKSSQDTNSRDRIRLFYKVEELFFIWDS